MGEGAQKPVTSLALQVKVREALSQVLTNALHKEGKDYFPLS